ncbi:MAG: hypothetical protein M1820_002646 [Bogoriella megaspora]|nr:MAG: hypothetical protein M1820_002646 [Bogoriella megaspora]
MESESPDSTTKNNSLDWSSHGGDLEKATNLTKLVVLEVLMPSEVVICDPGYPPTELQDNSKQLVKAITNPKKNPSDILSSPTKVLSKERSRRMPRSKIPGTSKGGASSIKSESSEEDFEGNPEDKYEPKDRHAIEPACELVATKKSLRIPSQTRGRQVDPDWEVVSDTPRKFSHASTSNVNDDPFALTSSDRQYGYDSDLLRSLPFVS